MNAHVKQPSEDLTGVADTPGSTPSARIGALWRMLARYLGLDRRHEHDAIATEDDLARFLETRASFVAQTSLYGYLRTRAGMRYPELFDNDNFSASINIAKWQVWLACLGDVAVYAGGLLAARRPDLLVQVYPVMQRVIDAIVERAGTPDDAGPAFADGVAALRRRVSECDWSSIADDESAFVESPSSLVQWAPIVDELKQLDEKIVRNSVRFRWQDVRRDLRRQLDAETLLTAADAVSADGS